MADESTSGGDSGALDVPATLAEIKGELGRVFGALSDLGNRVGQIEADAKSNGTGAVTRAEFDELAEKAREATYIADKWFGAEIADYRTERAKRAADTGTAGA